MYSIELKLRINHLSFQVRCLCLLFIVTANTSSALGQSELLSTMREWRTSLTNCTLELQVTTTEILPPDEKYQSTHREKLIVGENFERGITLLLQERPDNREQSEIQEIYGVLGDSSLYANYQSVRAGESAASSISSSQGTSFLDMSAGKTLMLYSMPRTGDLLDFLEGINDWDESSSDDQITYRGSVDGKVQELKAISTDPTVPSEIKISTQFTQDGKAYSYEATTKFQSFSAFENGKKVPVEIQSTQLVWGEGYEQRVEQEIRLSKVERLERPFNNWSDVLEMPDGSDVIVSGMPQIKFEWRNNEIVRAVDGVKLADISKASFIGSPWKFVLFAGLSIGAFLLVWTGLKKWK